MEGLLSADQGSVTGYYYFELIKSIIRDSRVPVSNIVHVLQGLPNYHCYTSNKCSHTSPMQVNQAKSNRNTTSPPKRHKKEKTIEG
jgi:hypothetical protein